MIAIVGPGESAGVQQPFLEVEIPGAGLLGEQPALQAGGQPWPPPPGVFSPPAVPTSAPALVKVMLFESARLEPALPLPP